MTDIEAEAQQWIDTMPNTGIRKTFSDLLQAYRVAKAAIGAEERQSERIVISTSNTGSVTFSADSAAKMLDELNVTLTILESLSRVMVLNDPAKDLFSALMTRRRVLVEYMKAPSE
jgi:hypothetical protein